MNDLSDNPKEDGYNIVRLFLQYHPNAEADIQTTMDIYAEATEEKKQETFEHLAATMDVF